MTLDDLIRFSDDLRRHGKVSNTVRRMGDEAVLKVAGREFFFDRRGRYRGMGRDHHSAIANLVAGLDTTPINGMAAIDDALPDKEDT